MYSNSTQLDEFIDYVYSFYNVVDGLYPVVGCTKNKIQLATVEYFHKCDTYPNLEWGEGDSLDRERVRDIMNQIYDGEPPHDQFAAAYAYVTS